MTSTASRIETIARELSGVGPSFTFSNETDIAAPPHMGGLDLDSLDRIELVVHIEREFNIEIPDEDVDQPAVGTFGGLVAYVQGKLDAAKYSALPTGPVEYHLTDLETGEEVRGVGVISRG